MAHLRDVGGVADAADVVQSGGGGLGGAFRHPRLEGRHHREPVRLPERHQPDRDRDLCVDAGREVAEERLVEPDPVRGRDRADSNRIGARRGELLVDRRGPGAGGRDEGLAGEDDFGMPLGGRG